MIGMRWKYVAFPLNTFFARDWCALKLVPREEVDRREEKKKEKKWERTEKMIKLKRAGSFCARAEILIEKVSNVRNESNSTLTLTNFRSFFSTSIDRSVHIDRIGVEKAILILLENQCKPEKIVRALKIAMRRC